MLINNNFNNNGHVEFVSYTGKWPSLCMGLLTLKIDGKEVKFGYDPSSCSCGNYGSFWRSGGCCGFSNNYSESYVDTGEWYIDVDDIPDIYMKYAREIDDVFNENVPWGCCGGCL